MTNEALLDIYSLSQLVDLLADSTTELLHLMNKKGADGILIRDKRREVQMIQAAIEKRKSSKQMTL